MSDKDNEDNFDVADDVNVQLILVSGESGSGKSASLQNIRNQPRWLYMNCEAGKRLPFRNEFESVNITDPFQVEDGMVYAKETPDVDGVVIDTVTFLMDMFESQYVLGTANTMEGWSQYQQFFKRLMQKHVASLGKPVIILGHTRSDYDETSMSMKTSVPIKGALKNQGVEAYFSTVVSTKKESLKDLKDSENAMLTITEDDEIVGFKHVFQTRLTKKTVGERIRSPIGMFSRNETFINNDAQMLLDHLNQFYS